MSDGDGLYRWQLRWERWRTQPRARIGLLVAMGLGVMMFLAIIAGIYESREPALLQVEPSPSLAPGVLLVRTTARVARSLYDKPGGYLANDLTPPGVWLDDMPHWELGVLAEVRAMVHALHEQWGLSRADYVEDDDLSHADTDFAVDPQSWWFPRPEREFQDGVGALHAYADRLALRPPQAIFLARDAALRQYLDEVDDDLGRMSAHLNAAVPQVGAEGDRIVARPTTSWWRIDDVFYEARGRCWALVPLLQALDSEYATTLQQRHADLSMRAAIHELEATQQTLWSPMVLNGSGFGLFANHSLTLANYIDRAHLDLSDVVSQLGP